MKQLILFSLLSVLLCSCYSYRINKTQLKRLELNDNRSTEKKKIYIINPEVSEEYSILQASNIFQIVSDSLDTTALKIKLIHSEQYGYCANFLIGWAMFLGQIPITVPQSRNFSFTEIKNGEETLREFKLPLYTRYWFWDIFSRRKKYNKVAGQALRLSFGLK